AGSIQRHNSYTRHVGRPIRFHGFHIRIAKRLTILETRLTLEIITARIIGPVGCSGVALVSRSADRIAAVFFAIVAARLCEMVASATRPWLTRVLLHLPPWEWQPCRVSARCPRESCGALILRSRPDQL